MNSSPLTSMLPELKRERIHFVSELCQRLRSNTGTDTDERLLSLLAKDAKWDVRKAVADNLAGLPEKLFVVLLSTFLNDDNQDVRRSAQRMRRERTLNPVAPIGSDKGNLSPDPFEPLGAAYGKTAVALAKRISSEQMNAIVGSVVHELRNILTPITGYAEQLMALSENINQEWHDRLNAIRERNQRSCRMIDMLLKYSEPVELSLRQEMVLEMAHKAVASQNPDRLAPDKNVQVIISVPPDLRLQADSDKLLCALENLLKNAIESFNSAYCRQVSPRVTLSAMMDAENSLVTIKIEDNGPGIPSEALVKLRQFLPGSGSNKPGSMGFGLSNVARFVRAHGGTIAVDSELDVGTCVSICLPATLEE